MGAGSGRAAQVASAAAAHSRKRTTSASEPRGAKYHGGSKGSKREAEDILEWECLLVEHQARRDAAWCVMLQQSALTDKVPVESALALLDVGYPHGTTSTQLKTS